MTKQNAIKRLAYLHANVRYSSPFDLSSKNIAELWDYRAEGLTVVEAKTLIHREMEIQKQARSARSRSKGKDVLVYAKGRRLSELRRRQEARVDFQRKRSTATLAGNARPYETFKVDDTTFGKVMEDVSYDNNAYAKSYGFGKKIVSNKRVEFHVFDNKTATYKIETICVPSFGGYYLEKVVAKYQNVTETKVAKELKSIQLMSLFSIHLVRNVFGVQVWERRIGVVLWDYCLVCEGITYHTTNIKFGLKRLREKIYKSRKEEAERILSEDKLLSKQLCMAQYDFCETGINSFCELNGIDPNGEMTIRELRNVVLKDRVGNCTHYRHELAMVGINLNCK